MKIIKGDTISVIAGKDKGREGKVERVYPKSERVLIENINMFKKDRVQISVLIIDGKKRNKASRRQKITSNQLTNT